ncbi:hypothetical protein B484DRAFT_444637 [Ochromonadaceae sp. CCMP2298]|nr:hypothetical protein B484DRAFT_444637 [Ochromonadaceae sp. CCMP2298]
MTAADVGRVGLDAPAVKAYALLDKLLQFDKENAQRTHVHDAQADYYESGTWLSETEKDDIARREKARLDAKKNANGSRKINIRFDIAGRRVVDCVSEDEEEQEEEQEEGGSARPAWMLDEAEAEEAQGTKGPQKSNGAQGAQGSYATATSSEELAQEQLAAVAFSVYDNLQLEQTRGKAGDIYRTLKKKWDQEA